MSECQRSMIKVTIMIPTYNQAAYLQQAIESALSQNYPNLEIIVGDDASTDATNSIVSKISDPRLTYVRNAINLGRTGNYRNLLFNYASGDFVVNLDGDDYYIDPDFISDAVKLIYRYDNVIMVVARALTKEGDKEQSSCMASNEIATGREILQRLPNSKYLVMHLAVIYSRKHAIDIGFYRSPALSSDWESIYRLALRGNTCYLNKKVGVWRIHENNETGTGNHIAQLQNLSIWPSIYNDATFYGMNRLAARFITAKCVAYFAQYSCAKVSKNGSMAFFRFFYEISINYQLATLFLFLYPLYLTRLVLCLVGYYRLKDSK